MATIERVIDGKIWKVMSDGNVIAPEHRPILNANYGHGELRELSIALALYDEWQSLKAQEDRDAPPRVELPGPEWTWYCGSDRQWRLKYQGVCLYMIEAPGSIIYEGRRIVNAAADELASRRPAAEHETRGAK